MNFATGVHDALPPGFRETVRHGARLVSRDDVHAELCAALSGASLHAWAGARQGARALQGRGVAWAAPLDDGSRVVVRHARHGGMLGRLTGDLFLTPSRAPMELAASMRLRAGGVPTPDVLAYATYVAVGPLCRADVVTAEVAGADLPAAWSAAGADGRAQIARAVGSLLRRLRDAGAVHDDLNAKNILMGRADAQAWVLDVDRVRFPRGGPVMRANAARLARSLAKWHATHGLDFGADDWGAILDAAGALDAVAWGQP